MVYRTGRKRTRSSQPSPADFAEEVGEFDVDHASDSDFEETGSWSRSEERPERFSFEIGKEELQSQGQAWAARYSSVPVQPGLVVSKRKAKEVLLWLRAAIEDCGPRFLVLAGPPGCGKSSAVRAAAMDMKCGVVSWQAPVTGQRNISLTLLEDFQAFFVGGRYQALQLHGDDDSDSHPTTGTKVLLVEDLPVSVTDYLQKRLELRKILSEAALFAPHPTVFLISDSERGISRTVRLLLGSDLVESAAVATINVPPVTDAMMKRRLREVLAIEGCTITKRELHSITTSSSGDIRAALNAVQFYTAKKLGKIPENGHCDASNENSRTKRRRRCKQSADFSTLDFLGQDATLGMYHAVSKILNNKKADDGGSKYDVEDILDDARADPSSFLAFLYQNYPPFFSEVDDAVAALQCLSDADCLLAWRQDDLARHGLQDCAASVVTRGFLVHNTKPIRTGWRPIRGSEFFEVANERRAYAAEVTRCFRSELGPAVITRSMMCETVPFAQQIKKSKSGSESLRSGRSNPQSFNVADNAVVDLKCNDVVSSVQPWDHCSEQDSASSNSQEEHDLDTIEDWDEGD